MALTMLSKSIFNAIEAQLSKREYVVKDRFAPMRSYSDFLELVVKGGFSPATVIDVGVADGTPWLYDAFPEAYLVLIEPQSAFAGPINAMLEKRSGEWHNIAVGDSEATTILNVMQSAPSSSSLLEMSAEHKQSYADRNIDASMETITVNVKRLDSLDHSHWPKPCLLKIDAEGFETQVIKGATSMLDHVDIVIAEIALNQAYGDNDFVDTLSAFKAAGFHLYDIIGMQARQRTGRVTMMDGVFVREGCDPLASV
ncbi:FkbM family methyltransferase [Parasphingorhabdus sp. DH2-15]|uniref:FkbM family methyltransferase n=1 Tax=Parasphingorhabdus sp. DH2-15 TaxID=3444112 RepID=UPI003F6842DE